MSSLTQYYLLFKLAHFIAIIGWMVGLLYLPRLFAYHAKATPGSETDLTFQQMEHNLLRLLITPCMIIVFLTGILLLIAISAQVGGWFHVKFLLVLILGGLHGMMSAQRKKFERGENTKTASYYRTLSRITTFTMVVILFLAVLKPF
ncbi:MAG: CopD family protein [Candidatus Latescibacteria bacterium]|jgi:putative membrane protein|nr:CopD family protein [Candidatus Latescibacterota bacterium]